jgi:hypothetical protein
MTAPKRCWLLTASLVVGVAIVVYYGWWIFASGDVFHTAQRNAPNRVAIVRLHEDIDIGKSYADVLSAYWNARTDELRIRNDSPTEWAVQMPGEFGASDWTLLIEFQDGHVSAVRVRTSDGPPPKNAPKDKQLDAT